jgi:Fe2+ or Zn2+ uptake regulation protein
VQQLREHGIQPSAQRVAIAEYVLFTDEHPSAEQVLERVRARFPMLSRATVYNTLNLFVHKGLLRELVLTEGRVVFDPKTERHHHFVDTSTGAIYDVPWEAAKIEQVRPPNGFVLEEFQLVMHGRRRRAAKR